MFGWFSVGLGGGTDVICAGVYLSVGKRVVYREKKVLTEKTCKCSEHACAVLSPPPPSFALNPERLTPFMMSRLESVFINLAPV